MNIFNQDETSFLKNLSSSSSTHQYQSISSDDINNLDDNNIIITVKNVDHADDEIGTDGCSNQINSIQSTKYPIKFILWRFFLYL